MAEYFQKKSNWPIIAGSTAAAAAAVGTIIYLVRREDQGGGQGGGGQQGGGGGQQGGGQQGGGGQGDQGGGGGGQGDQGNLPPMFAPDLASPAWGNVPADWRPKIKAWSDALKMPHMWAFMAVVMRREAGFKANAQNTDKHEVTASQNAIANGLKRGNPPPKWAVELGQFGSGGLFGALAPYFAWIGLDEGYMPFLNRRANLIFNPDASAVFAGHYAWRVLSNYKVRDWFDLRTGWASPSVLKNDPDGTTAKGVRSRMQQDIDALGLQWLAQAPLPNPKLYPGINVTAPMFGFNPQQVDN